ncbi:HlyD family type I secretion periplasmic adaptor subunit [Comamonas endophytica]|uniref:Membrane fusion protein (MFP) family protein n=1 Tax=Comamonas endophytica TaxID=2949090 RepID=A0ABY6GB10_9BURK|nr:MULTISPECIES: HlyD family type I secretion periplasmic adaptor subunit [unclassified Acidovorax]MCD2513920.1 HlyD family type I secretion periplasmic adaptor subunit [Acidovorax sp. D4N7]UYG52086.1 HlyD family type I secretion periplasmic adaptor subunit [Acidovorax sp. 5MLIR]
MNPSLSTPHPAPAPAAGAAAADAGRIGRIGLLTLALGFGGFLLWAAFAPLDEGVPSAGMVAIDTKRKAVQHLSGGIIEKVVVREGDRVHAGQLLIRLDSALARANHEASRQRYLGLRAMQARLTAEHLGAQSLVFHDDLQAAAADPLIRQQMHTQEQLFDTRRQLLRSDLQSIEESIQGQRGMYEAYVRMLRSRQSQQESLDTELNSLRGLVAEGYAPRNRQHELERLVADAHSGMADLLGNTVRAQRSMAELRQRAFSRQQEQRREVQTQLAEVEREVLAEQEKLKALADELGRMDIKSPADGQVVGLAAQTVGGVVQPGEKLMDIVPLNAPLLLESQVAPHLIDRVHAELPVDVRFSSFAHSPQLVVEGRVQSVSSDLLTDAQTLASYYLARVEVTPEGLQRLGKRQLQPGMPVEVVFKTGERSLLTYLLHPLTKRIAASLTEE